MRFKHADVHMAFILIVIIIALVVAQSNTTEEIIAAATANATLPSVSDLEPVTNSNAIHLGMLIPLLGPNDWVLDLAFSHDGKLLAAATIKGDVYVWQTQTGSLLSVSSPSTHDLPSSGLSFSPDGSILASSAGSDVILWNIKDISQGKIKTDTVFQNQKSFVRNLDFSPDGTILASRADDGTVRLWDMSTRSSIADFRGDDGGSGALLFSSNGDLLISASQGSDEGSTTYVWSVKTKTRKFTLDGHAPIALSPNSSKLAVWSGGDSPQILIYDLDTQA